MMPMPPTRSEIEATAASSSAMIRLLPSAVSGDLTEVATVKSLTSPGPDPVAAHQMLRSPGRSQLAPAPGSLA